MAARRGPGPVAALALLALLGPGWSFRGARAALNLQELSELKYGLEILAEPVLAGQVRRGTGANGWGRGRRASSRGGLYRDRRTDHGAAEEGGTGCGSRGPAAGAVTGTGNTCPGRTGAELRSGAEPSPGHRSGAEPGPGEPLRG